MTIKLQSELNIRQVAELKAQLDEALTDDVDIVFDASDVEVVDAAALQLLLAFVQQLALKQRSVTWGELSEGFLSAVKLTGLDKSLNLQV